MKSIGITKHSHLLYCIENYIIRTQSFYDRLLIVIDSVFCLYNPSHLISHELIISNLHIKQSEVPAKLKGIKNVVKGYYRSRNEIIHERNYLEDELHKLEAFSIFSNMENTDDRFSNLARSLRRQIIKDKTNEFTKINKKAFIATAQLFDTLELIYDKQRNMLEAIYGKINVLVESD